METWGNNRRTISAVVIISFVALLAIYFQHMRTHNVKGIPLTKDPGGVTLRCSGHENARELPLKNSPLVSKHATLLPVENKQ